MKTTHGGGVVSGVFGSRTLFAISIGSFWWVLTSIGVAGRPSVFGLPLFNIFAEGGVS